MSQSFNTKIDNMTNGVIDIIVSAGCELSEEKIEKLRKSLKNTKVKTLNS